MSGSNRAGRRRQKAVTADIVAAAEYHAAGRLDKAEALCRKILRRAPDDIDASHLLGLLALERGHSLEAIKLIKRVVARRPELPHAWGNLGNAYRAVGAPAEARASYQKATALQPDFALAHTNLGLLLYEQGDLAAALESCRRAADLDPRNPDILNNLGNVQRALGRLETAEASLRQVVKLRPDRADFQVNLGNLLVDLRRPEEAAFFYRRAIDIQPGYAPAHHGLGISLRLAGDAEGSTDSLRKATALSPDQAAYWNDLGGALRALGQFTEAADAFRRALALSPDFADAYRNLALCQRLPADDAEIARLSVLANKPMLAAEERAIAGFALGKLLDDGDRYDAAFEAYAKANATYRELRAGVGERFNPDALRRQVDETIAMFSPAFFGSVAEWGNPSELPVFIVGMPRSGTSLVEQIAASHSQVFGAGELKHIGELVVGLGVATTDWQRQEIRAIADGHVDRLRSIGRGAIRVIDKLPDNVFHLGIIAALFPSARVIYCDRDSRDTALSCFFQKFSAGQLVFSYDLADCGKRHRETARLMAYWRRVLPLQMLEVSYEALVADLEAESRRLVTFLGLAWEPACLEFHRTQRTVLTASGWQVRQPIYTRSVGRWRHYQRYLGPLLAELDAPENADA